MSLKQRATKAIVIILAAFLGLTLSFSMVQKTSASPEEVYYSDLFFGYDPSYLTNDYFNDYSTTVNNTLSAIYDDYLDSSSFWTALRSGLDAATNLRDYAAIIFDALGITDSNYEEALDKANQKFASNMLHETLETSIVSETKYSAKALKAVKKILGVYEQFRKSFNWDVMSFGGLFSSYGELLADSDVYESVQSSEVNVVFSDVLPDFSTTAEIAGLGIDALELANGYALALMIEDLRMEVIDDVQKNAVPGTTLYEGMSRLKEQLRNGWSSYFQDNYFTGKVAEELCSAMQKAVLGQLTPYGLCTAVIKVLDLVVFEWIFDVPDLSDVLTMWTLKEYCSSMSQLLFQKMRSNMSADDISELEGLFGSYTAMVDAALSAAEKLEISSNQGTAQSVKSAYADFSYDSYIEFTKDLIRDTPVEERILRHVTTWPLTGDITLRAASDEIESGGLYMFHGSFPHSISMMNGNLIIVENSAITGDLTCCANGSLIFDGGQLEIGGDLTLADDNTRILMSGSEESLLVHGNFQGYNDPSVYSNSSSRVEITAGTAQFKGDFSNPENARFSATGDSVVIFSGEGTQNITGTASLSGLFVIDNLYIRNPEVNLSGFEEFTYTLQEDTEITGIETLAIKDLDLNGYSLSIPGSLTISPTGTFTVSSGFELPGDLTLQYYSSLIFDGGQLEVGGDLTLADANSKILMSGAEESLLVHGNFQGYSDPSVYSNSSSRVEITAGTAQFKGDFSNPENARFSATGDSKVIFSGEGTQNITGTASLSSLFVIDNLYIRNPAVTLTGFEEFTYTLREDTEITGIETLAIKDLDLNGYNLSIPGSLKISPTGTFTVSSGFELPGDLTLQYYSSLIFDGGQLEVGGDLTLADAYSRIVMSGAEESLLVHGNFQGYSDSSYSSVIMTGGTAQFKGDFSNPENARFSATGDSQVIFSGEGPQNITGTASLSSLFVIDNLYIRNPAVTLTGFEEFTYTLREDTEITGTETLTIKTIDLNGYHLFVRGELSYTTLLENGGELTVRCNPSSLVHHDAVEPGCEEEGTLEYWSCMICERCYSDENADTEIELEDTIVPATGHDYIVESETEPTCTTEGQKVYVCRHDESHTYTEVIPRAAHTPSESVHENETPATCTQDGSYEEVVYCSVCHAELSRENKVIAKTGHTPEVMPAVDATCTETGLTEGSRCSVCGEIFIAQEIIPASGHDWGDWEITKEPTEEEPGEEKRVCLNDPTHFETREIPALAHHHVMIKVDLAAATCTETGNIEYWTCTGCGRIFEDETGEIELNAEDIVIPAAGHTPAEAVIENEIPATVDSDGSYDEVVYCSVCGAEISRTTTVITRLHRLSKVDALAATCTEAGNIEYWICSDCGKIFADETGEIELNAEDLVIPTAGHTPAEAVTENYIPATGSSEGSYDEVVYCSVCGDEISRNTTVIPRLKEGWIREDGAWYYYRNNERTTGWQKIGGTWYYMDPATAVMQTGWLTTGGKTYYLASNGAMKTGWVSVGGKWYYANSAGILQTGWIKVGSSWYYLNADGVMQTGWVKEGSSWYYMNASGVMQTGWVKSGNAWYYMGSNGVMTTGWQKISNSWYFMKPSGVMAANEWYDGYWFNASGTWTYQPRGSWKKNSKGWWFGDTSGWYAKNTTLTIDGVRYTFNSAGYWVQ